jgi:hypothetical protein
MERGKLKDLLFSGDEPQGKDEEFHACVNLILDRSNALTNFEMLQLFGLYKQVTEGNQSEPRPIVSGNSVAAAKW